MKAIIKNLIYAWHNRGEINHITGDVHYIALATGRNTVLTVHDVDSALRGSFLNKLIIKFLWFWLPALCVKRITTVSPKSQEELGRLIPFARKKITVVPNPYNPRMLDSGNRQVAVGRANERDARPVVFLVGTKPNKNLERTIEALGSLQVRLIILGKLTAHQTELLDQYNFDYTSHFNISYSTVVELYNMTDLVCFASLYEGFGVPVIEAQLAGKPVVTSNIDPLKWVAGTGACLVDPLRVDSIRAGIVKVLNNDDYRAEIVENGKENVLRFEPGTIASMYRDVYKELHTASSK